MPYCNVDKFDDNNKGDYSMGCCILLLWVFHSSGGDDGLMIMMIGDVVATGCGRPLGV